MLIRLKSIAVVAASIALVFSLMIGAFAQTPEPSTPASTPTSPATTPPTQEHHHRHHGERHPEISRAIRHLKEARYNLQRGAHDFAGHRVKALELTNQALQECQQALKADKQ